MDLALVEAARSGDEEAFASIARGSADRLFAVAHRILRDVGRAEDAVQQTLVTAWRELPSLRDIERFEAWIHRILVNTCYTEVKRASKWSANVVALPTDGPATPDDTLSIDTRDALDRGFRRLPAEQRAAFVLHHYLGWSVGEIAENLGVTSQAVSKTVRELEGLGYVQRAVDAADGRVRRVALTARGRAVLEAGRAIRAEINAELEAALGEERVTAAATALRDALAARGAMPAVAARRLRSAQDLRNEGR